MLSPGWDHRGPLPQAPSWALGGERRVSHRTKKQGSALELVLWEEGNHSGQKILELR